MSTIKCKVVKPDYRRNGKSIEPGGVVTVTASEYDAHGPHGTSHLSAFTPPAAKASTSRSKSSGKSGKK